MSLIGSLEDLGLGDILQIISLSQKSGVLSIRGDDREGTIILHEGLVRGAFLKGGPTDLRSLLVDGGFVASDEFDRAREAAAGPGTTVEHALAESTSLTVERIDSLRRESVEAAVVAMFGWHTGDFSFDVRTDQEAPEQQLFLPTGISAQYLAMEGSRIDDESVRRSSGERVGSQTGEASEDFSGLSAHEMFGVVTDAGEGPDSGSPDEQVAAGPGEKPGESSNCEPEGRPSAADALAAGVARKVDAQEGMEAEASPSKSVALPKAAPPLVVIDPDLVALEWIKEVLKDSFPRIHIFQRWDLGLNPIRQYLARTVKPLVLVRVGAPGDPLSGIRSAPDFVRRLKTQQPEMSILWLREDGGPLLADAGVADGVVTVASALLLRNPRAAPQLAELATELRGALATQLERGAAQAEAKASSHSVDVSRAYAEGLRSLTEATARLSDASSRGEVLPLVIRFAREIFDRVAMFMVRGDGVVGIAQQGLALAGGPDDAGLREIEIRRDSCAWFRAVFESGSPVRAAPSDAGDLALAARLGRSAAPMSYVASIDSGGDVVALLYADNLPSRRPLGESRALEVVLQHAGLALERTMLERALAEAEGGGARDV